MKCFFLFILLVPGSFCMCQEKNYYCNIDRADTLYAAGNYYQATSCYQAAFQNNNGTAEPEDLFKLLRCYVLSGEPAKAFNYIDNLCKADFINYILLEKDSVLVSLKNASPRKWSEAIDCLKRNKAFIAPQQNLEWTNLLDGIFDQDQRIRRQYRKEADKYGGNSELVKSLFQEMRFTDSMNLIRIRHFIDTHGWMGSGIVGDKGSTTLFLVIQHSDSATQEAYLPILRAAVKEKKARPQELALMEDRLSLAKFGYQLYGSQINQDTLTKAFYIERIKDETNVNKRRSEMGLDPLEEYVKQWSIDYNPKRDAQN